ncbi:MAG: endonuclease/exonuclease/phosphatase family protein, partial [Saprospiraceae bacterium]|nr:endonuclease/exonuclease/phosphatase family protein [Saprospiraceae bacterium]
MTPTKPFLIFLIALLSGTVTLTAQNDYKVAAVGFYNLENLFDTIDNPATNDEDFLPKGRLLWDSEKYAAKQANMAKVISQMATELTPDGVAVLGVAEIECRLVLEDLVKQPALADRHYQVVQYDSPDERGIDCGLLYNPKYFTLFGSRALPVGLKDSKTGIIDYTRDILLVSGQFEGEMVHFMVGHWPSRRGGEAGSAWM